MFKKTFFDWTALSYEIFLDLSEFGEIILSDEVLKFWILECDVFEVLCFLGLMLS